MLTLTARIQQRPPDNLGGHDLAVDQITTEAASYEEGRAQLERVVPDGWRILSILVDR